MSMRKSQRHPLAVRRKISAMLSSDAYKAAFWELRQAQASVAYQTTDKRRLDRLSAAQKAVSDLISF